MDPLELLVTNDLLRVLDLLGVFVMGVAAGALASRLNFDAVGFAIIGIAAGLGGGIVRDLILDYGTPAAFDGPWYLACALGGSLFSFVISAEGTLWRRLVTGLDIMAMGLWAATGTAKSLGYGLDVLPAILLGVASAVGGGVIRDVLVGRIPAIFGGGPLYATGAFLTALLTWAVFALGMPAPWVLGAVGIGAVLAGLAAWRQWTLPAHSEWQVTMSASQLKALVRRTRRSERTRVAMETGTIPVVDDSVDDLAEDVTSNDADASSYAERAFDDEADELDDAVAPEAGEDDDSTTLRTDRSDNPGDPPWPSST
ncbi:trimeric intracellular cation channel family protein [Brachybacterium sp. GCM10030267]|uniref:trimeric intracellular cation channel family protein n=1 Tax=unclassified Brachybacterium TaxID=2623841 RepID=UPI00360BD904